MRLPWLKILLLLPALPARADDNWNQWNEPAVSGVGAGATKLALGIDYGRVPDAHTGRLGGDVEGLLSDHWGVQGRVALPLGGTWVAPALVGVRMHLLPLTPFDPFVGVGGGVAWMRLPGRAARMDPITTGGGGFTFYYFGLFFLEAEARYDLVRFAPTDGARDLSGLVLDGRTGVYF